MLLCLICCWFVNVGLSMLFWSVCFVAGLYVLWVCMCNCLFVSDVVVLSMLLLVCLIYCWLVVYIVVGLSMFLLVV